MQQQKGPLGMSGPERVDKDLRAAARIKYSKKSGHAPDFFVSKSFEMAHLCAFSKLPRPEPRAAAGVAVEKL